MRCALDGVQGIAVQRAHRRCRDTTHAERMRSDVLLWQELRRCTTVGSTPHWWTHHGNVGSTGRGVAYPLAADNVSSPLVTPLKGLHQPVVRSRLPFSA